MRMRVQKWLAGLCATFVSIAGIGAASGGTMQWSDLLDRPRPKADVRIIYGPDPLQFADLWLPRGKAPHPVVLMVHGGCWQTDIADASIMNYIADDLRTRGIAVWNIEYRGVDRNGGGFPGTFLDVAAAADALGKHGPHYHLETGRVVAFGHSAGGHLALWLAARSRIPKMSPLFHERPLPIAAAISIGGLPDLEAAQSPPGDTCDAEPVRKLVGMASNERPNVYVDTSPVAMFPFGTPQILVNATRDRIAPPIFAENYAAKAKLHGTDVRRVTVPDEGHVELIAPGTASWAAELAEIRRALGQPED
ncbi:alpha/beta hydrolase family protein [Aquisediminimonas profunda]|uniref:alpha/beta hydrolase family protein n=1 Tax=Aquisediminimonas profunda TaxID=1550733 RepID=UPI001FE2F0CE|nr:alpha/beta hydrolase [Aquisediminimonas profunda]